MSPNPFTLIKLTLSPHKWATRRSPSTQSVKPREQWESPVPGIYEYKPGRGWYLVEYVEDAEARSDSNASNAAKTKSKERLPRHLTYCKVLHRMMFTTEYNERRHIEYVKTGDSYQVQQVGFFRLDDETTYVQCWDSFGNFVEGPYQRWCIDSKTKRMRPMQVRDAVISGEEVRESRHGSWEKMQRQQSITGTSHHCSVCSSPSVRSIRRPAFEGRASASTVAESSRSQGTSLTTPSSGIISRQQTTDEVDAKKLRAELEKIHT